MSPDQIVQNFFAVSVEQSVEAAGVHFASNLAVCH